MQAFARSVSPTVQAMASGQGLNDVRPRRVLLLLKGQPGSGKSTLGAALAAALALPLLDKDTARDALQPAAERACACKTIDWNGLAYELLFAFLGAALAVRTLRGAVLDCPLARRPLFDRAAALAAAHGAAPVLVECRPGDEAVWRARLEARGAADAGTPRAHKPGSWAALEAVRARDAHGEGWSDAAAVEGLPRIVVDVHAAGGATAAADRVVAFLRASELLPE